MTLRRGFKTQAKDLATEVRGELSVDPFDRLDPHTLATHLSIRTIRLSDLATESTGAQFFLTDDPAVFSALTVFDGRRRMIAYNDSHPPARQNSDLAHELGHALLLHDPMPALDGLTGCRTWNDAIEEEATWLSGELLVTRPMALAVARGQLTQQAACELLGVSAQMLDWRLNMTGARRQAARERGAG